MEFEAAPDIDIEEPVAEPALHEKLAMLAQATGDISAALDANLLADIGRRAVDDYEKDKADRADWAKTVQEALEAASQEAKGEAKTYPWPNAANIKYPLLTIGALQFNARSLRAIIKGDEAVLCKVIGNDKGKQNPEFAQFQQLVQGAMAQAQASGQQLPPPSPEQAPPQWITPPGAKAARAERVRTYMNTVLFYRMEDWKSDTDTLLLQLPIVGCVFRKVYYDSVRDMQCSALVPALRLLAPKGAKSCKTAPRLTEEIPDVFPSAITQGMRDGTYREVDLFPQADGPLETEPATEGPRLLLEQHRYIDLDDDGLGEPYIVTVDHQTAQVLRIEPNFGPDDIVTGTRKVAAFDPVSRSDVMVDQPFVRRIERGQFYIKYDFFPHPEGKFYGIGLGHLLKQLGNVIDTAINQMIDAGTAQTAGGGFVSSGVRLTGSRRSSNLRFAPGEYKTVDVPADVLKNGIVERTFPGPSQIMLQVLEMMLGAAQEISSVKDVLTGEASNNGQVGTTLALIEQGLQVYSAIYTRIFWAEQEEFTLLKRNLERHATDAVKQDYLAVLDDPEADFDRDFNSKDMDVRPVSDPSSVTKLQQMARAQFLGGFVNLPWIKGPEVTKRMLEAADTPDIDDLLVDDWAPQPNPKDMAGADKLKAGAELDAEKAKTEQAKRAQMAIDNFAKGFGTFQPQQAEEQLAA